MRGRKVQSFVEERDGARSEHDAHGVNEIRGGNYASFLAGPRTVLQNCVERNDKQAAHKSDARQRGEGNRQRIRAKRQRKRTCRHPEGSDGN